MSSSSQCHLTDADWAHDWTDWAAVLQDPVSHLGLPPHLNLVWFCYSPLNQTLNPPTHPTFPIFSLGHKASLCSCTVLLLRRLQLNMEMVILTVLKRFERVKKAHFVTVCALFVCPHAASLWMWHTNVKIFLFLASTQGLHFILKCHHFKLKSAAGLCCQNQFSSVKHQSLLSIRQHEPPVNVWDGWVGATTLLR